MAEKKKPGHDKYRRYDGRPSDEEQLGTRLGKNYEPPTLGQSLDRLVRNLGAPPISVLSQLKDRWPDIVGPALSGTTRPVELVDGVMTIACDDAAWAAQVGWMEAQIMQRFEDVFGPGQLRRLAVRTDR